MSRIHSTALISMTLDNFCYRTGRLVVSHQAAVCTADGSIPEGGKAARGSNPAPRPLRGPSAAPQARPQSLLCRHI
jgi:hypothetical protein